MSGPDDVVGHKTFIDDDGRFRHEPLTRSEADELHMSWEKSEQRRQQLMPTEQSAIDLLFDAWYRLTKDFGWKDACYAPRDGTRFVSVSLGSTGQHECYGDKIGYWCLSHGDLWPTKPALIKPLPPPPETTT